jgi:hypothetical protein
VAQNHHDGFLFCASKISMLWFVGCATKLKGGCDGVGHTLRTSGLLRMKSILTRIFQSGLKTDRTAMAAGARGTIAEVVSESS